MDPTTVQPPPPPPPYSPQNPHNPFHVKMEPSAFDCFQNGEPITTPNFKPLVFKLAGRLLPAHRPLIEQRLNDILPHELLIPDHPPYADMILTALWELKAEGGSSEEAISHYIKTEYHELPWAHATILNHHLRDLFMKGKITMTHDGCYTLCSSIPKPEPSPSPSSSSPLSSTDSSSSTSPSSSSSSDSWGGSYRTRKRRKIKGRKGKMVQVRGRDKGMRRRRGRGRGEDKSPMMIQAGQRCRGRGRYNVDGRNKLVEPEQETEDQNEVTVMGIEHYAKKDGDLPDVIAKISEEEDLPVEQFEENHNQPLKVEAEINNVNVSSDDKVTMLEVDVGDARVYEHVEQLEQKEDNQQPDVVEDVERQTSGEGQVMSDGNLSKEQGSVMMQCVEPIKQIDHLTKEHIETEEQDSVMMQCVKPIKQLDHLTKEQVKTEEQESVMLQCVEPIKQLDHLTEEQVETEEQDPAMQCVEPIKQLDHLTKEQIETEEQDSVMMQCVEPIKQLDHLTKEQVETEEQDSVMMQYVEPIKQLDHLTKEKVETEEQDSVMMQCVEPIKQLDHLTKEQVEREEQSGDLHDDDDFTEEQVHPQEQCAETIEESPQSCEQDQLKNVGPESAEQEEQKEVNQKEIVLPEVQEPFVELIEQQNQPFIQQTEMSEKDSIQEKNNLVTNKENMTSSGGTTEGSRRPSRPGLRSGSKKEDAASNSKKQLKLVTPIRRSLRSHKTVSEAAVITEVPDHSKEQGTHLGRTRSSTRKLESAEAEQVSNTRKTRRTGL
ncbi:hypothetical protein R6Q57_013883 [Mikania cordata]